jgi:hypothetical protein
MKELRGYQSQGAVNGCNILKMHNILYMAWSVRTGKTATSMEVCRLYCAKEVLFLTKKKAIKNIEEDYRDFGFDNHFNITVTNNESMHKIENPSKFDVVIHDESHRFGSLAKPNTGAKLFKKLFSDKPIILLSGTPSPESFSQMYHQFWISDYSPWRRYPNFYKWAADYVRPAQKRVGAFMYNDYSHGIEDKIMADLQYIMTTYTQEQAGFKSTIDEEVLHVKMLPRTYDMVEKLFADRVVQGKNEVILADTAAKLLQKVHQLYSGTVKFESGNSMILDFSKAEYIKERFANSRIGIFYVFKAELDALREVYGEELTTDIDEFDSGKYKVIALQTVSGREGITLKSADYLVFYNIMHSAVSYWQARDRMTTMDRTYNKVYWVFADGGIEDKIYKVVKSKKKYTTNIFKNDYFK